MSDLVKEFESKYKWTDLIGKPFIGNEEIFLLGEHPKDKNVLNATFIHRSGNIWLSKSSGYYQKQYILDNLVKIRKNVWTEWYFRGSMEIGGYYVV